MIVLRNHICHERVPCAIRQDIDSRPQSEMYSPDTCTRRTMGYDFMKHKLRHMFTVRLVGNSRDTPFMKVAVQ